MFTINKIKLLKICLFVILLAISVSAATASNDELSRKLVGFSTLTHATGLVEAEYTFANDRLRDLLAKETVIW